LLDQTVAQTRAGKGNFTAGSGSYIGGYFADNVIFPTRTPASNPFYFAFIRDDSHAPMSRHTAKAF